MIEVKTLSDLDGADKYGTCMSCGKSSEFDKGMVRITALQKLPLGTYQGTAVCLCERCKKVLKEMLR